MYRLTIKEAVSEECGVFPSEYIGSRLYAVRDGDIVLYVGRSEDPLYRLQQHLGYERRLPSALGRLLLSNQPASHEWVIECYRLEDCQPFFERAVADVVDGQMREVLIQLAYADIERAEMYMIQVMAPCLNVIHNGNPSQLPERYRRPHGLYGRGPMDSSSFYL